MIYFSFGLIVNELIFYGVLLASWVFIFGSRMSGKEASFERKDGWETYRMQSWILLPKVAGSTCLSVLFYAIALPAYGYAIYATGGLGGLESRIYI